MRFASPWGIVRVIKTRRGKKLKEICRSVAYGCRNRAFDLIAMSQIASFQINTAYIERLNATFRARMPALVRRTRGLARTCQRLETEMFWTGTLYNFCTVHTSLEATPAMAAGLTDHVWSVDELLRHLRKFAKTLRNWWSELLNYFEQGVIQGFVEGINRAIRGIINRCFGFHRFDHFRLQVLAECGPP